MQKSLAVNMASANEKGASLITSPISILVSIIFFRICWNGRVKASEVFFRRFQPVWAFMTLWCHSRGEDFSLVFVTGLRDIDSLAAIVPARVSLHPSQLVVSGQCLLFRREGGKWNQGGTNGVSNDICNVAVLEKWSNWSKQNNIKIW